MHVVVFEGSRWHSFAPLSLSRPVFALASGACTLLEKQVRHLRPGRLTLWVRPELADFCRRELAPRFNFPVEVNAPLDEEPALLVSGRTLHFSRFEHTDEPCAIIDEGDVVRKAVVRMPGLGPADAMNRTDRWLELLNLPRMEDQARMASYVWDLINWNEESLLEDFVAIDQPSDKPAGPSHLLEDDNVWIGPEVSLGPGVVLDGRRGPIMISRGASIGANSVITGPVYIGEHCQIKPLTVIHPGCSIGPMCRIGGEVNNSILIGLSNKSHDGYLGDSYLGQWVNLGAGTTTSNLKNTYGKINIRIGGRLIDTGRRHMGSLIGDHTKTAIGTRLMTGSYVGYCCMIASSRYAPTFVRSFTFLTDECAQDYRLDKAMDVMKAVYARRNRVWPAAEESMVRYAREAAAQAEAV